MNRVCNFIISKSPEQLYLDTPVVVIVKTKNEKIVGVLRECFCRNGGCKKYI
ncbi:MAG: hypothetical protein MK289_01510 [Trichodesmium sp. ALOHA_ZT_67]|nr:hypothetical protein [Trichodesmium sp. ALOHA_ZT_67]